MDNFLNFFYLHSLTLRNCFALNPIQDGGAKSSPSPTSFSPVTSTNVGISPQNFLIFSFNPFATLVKNFKTIPQIIELEPRRFLEKKGFSGQILIKLRL